MRAGIASIMMLQTGSVWAAAACDTGQFSATMIDYEASIPAVAAPMAEWSVVKERFPNARGITKRIAYITADRIVQIDTGVGVKASMTDGVSLPFKGKELGMFKYKEQPIHRIRIQERNSLTAYDSATQKATKKNLTSGQASDALVGPALGPQFAAWDNSLPEIGKRKFAGIECDARRIPGAGPDAQACVAEVAGQQIALQFQWFDAGATQQLQWLHAVRVKPNVCVSNRELTVPAGVVIREIS